jgi:hypothetical protein
MCRQHSYHGLRVCTLLLLLLLLLVHLLLLLLHAVLCQGMVLSLLSLHQLLASVDGDGGGDVVAAGTAGGCGKPALFRMIVLAGQPLAMQEYTTLVHV